ncbi:glycosyltransferase family 4 protein [Pedobacter sp. AW1-32]|uniref:glycosyltransferase family 4 protein n=1 Tax=Pedobacter sp. AW1-32 TaxID=3383026 RepID=UPI003FF03D75
MKVVLASPLIAPHVKQSVRAYYEAGLLQMFLSTFIQHPESKIARLLKKFIFLNKTLNRRDFDELPIEYFKGRALPELIRSFSARSFGPILTDFIWEWAETSFDKWVSKQILKSKPDIVHTYEHAALQTLRNAAKEKIFSIYEQPSQHHSFLTPIIHSQIKKYPELHSSVSALLINKKAKRRNERRDEELRLAHLILCNSTFTKHTLILAGIKSEKIKVIPLAFPTPIQHKIKKNSKKPIRFLYAGNQSIRKGTHLLYEAWRMCNLHSSQAELFLVGSVDPSMLMGKSLTENTIIEGNMPHNELMDFYKTVDVLILPTLADGFGMVISEAMSQGVPVIATENSAGPDLIEHEKNGWIIPPNDVPSIVETIQSIVSDTDSLATFSAAALLKAKSWQWEDYRKSLVNTVQQEFKNFNETEPTPRSIF